MLRALEPTTRLDESGDAELVAEVLGGDGSAQQALHDRHRPAVRRLARAFADLDADDVEDVVQEAFVRAFRGLARLKEPARFGSWLLVIARNRALSFLARRRAGADLADAVAREGEGEGAAEPEPDFSDGGASAEVEVVRRIIAELPEGPEKETIRLFYLEGELSARQIADRLGVGKSAITMRLERFRAKVKRRVLAEVARLRGEGSWE